VNDSLNTALRQLTLSMLRYSREGFTRWTVVSDIDDDVHAFSDLEEALAFAADADGSIFELSVREIE